VVDRTTSRLFNNGFGFILPYVAVYLTGRAFNLPTSWLLVIFIALHGIQLVLLAVWALPRLRGVDPRMIGVWTALTLLFLVPGAYLEFPSDPWVHVERIYAWSTAAHVNDHETVDKFAYFWGWTWLGWVPIGWRPAGLATYSAFWQLLLAWQFYRLARILGFSKGWSVAQVIGTIALFGTNLFSFYRYYALSSTPLAYIAYLYALGTLLQPARPRTPQLVTSIAVAAVVAWANHAQELFFLAIMVPAILVFGWVSGLPLAEKRWVAALGAAMFLGSLALGVWLRGRHPELYLGKDAGISWLGLYGPWPYRGVFLETLALHGGLGVLAACAIAYARPRLAVLTLWPVVLLILPPFVLFTARVFPDDYVVYRVLYAFPTSFALIAAMEAMTGLVAWRGVIAVGLAGMSMIPVWPLRGRLYFQLYVPPAANRLAHLYPVASDLSRHAAFARDCLIASDRITSFFLTAHLGLGPRVERFWPDDLLERWAVSPSLDALDVPPLIEAAPVCAAVLLHPEQVPQSPGSLVARASRHWTERNSDPRAFVHANPALLLKRIGNERWVPIGPGSWLNPNAIALGLATPRPAGSDLER
jgi:hypothetical protein